MAREKGESVAFTALYAGNLNSLAQLLATFSEKMGVSEVEVGEEVVALIDTIAHAINYDDVHAKTARLHEYFVQVSKPISGLKASIPISLVIDDLNRKSRWIKMHINAKEWIPQNGVGWYNGYYDNHGDRVEGIKDGQVQMTLPAQVFPIMAGVADPERIPIIMNAINKYLMDEKLGGVRLNSRFKGEQPNLGRAFSFRYGDKENGAVFSHMAVMYANALYQRGFVEEGHRILESLYTMAKNFERGRIYPGLPEYFNSEGQGLYHYLTGSASWYVLTLLTQAFGVRGEGGNLVLAPKLVPSQFDKKGEASVQTVFAGVKLKVTYLNSKRKSYDAFQITSLKSGAEEIPFTRLTPKEILIQREVLTQRKEWSLQVKLDQ
jgi:hypothetical protein